MAYRLIIDGAHALDLDRDLALAGRRPGVDVPLPHPDVGGVHFRLERAGTRVYLVDAGTAAGTTVAGARVAAGERRELADGDEVAAGPFRLRFQARTPAGAPTSAQATADIARALVAGVLAALGRDAPASVPSLVVIAGAAKGRRFLLTAPGRDLVIGRGESCDAPIGDSDLSREHVRVHRGVSGVTIADLGSKNGTTVDGVRLAPAEPRPLAHGGRVSLGQTVLLFQDPTEAFLRSLGDEAQAEPRGRLTWRVFVPAALMVLGLALLAWVLFQGR